MAEEDENSASRKFAAIEARLRNLSPVLRVAAAALDKLMDDSFARQQSPDGTPWAKLSPVTVDRRIMRTGSGSAITYRGSRLRTTRGAPTARANRYRAPGGAQALIDTGRMRRSLHADVVGNTIRFGTNVVQGTTQFYGNPNNKMFGKARAPIPARPFMPVTPNGQPMARGPAGAFFDKLRLQLRDYILTGART